MFIKPRKDTAASDLPAPPRALSGHGALPVYGHTRLFCQQAGDFALLFPPDWSEVSFMPASWTRQLGECFAVFIWGQWRTAVKGPERSAAVLSTENLLEAWPWTPPVTLLGKSCLCFLQETDQQSMQQLLQTPLHHDFIVQYAPIFAAAAEKCLGDVEEGRFTKGGNTQRSAALSASSHKGDNKQDVHQVSQETEQTASSDFNATHKVKWEALRSYTFDLVDGPILGMNKWNEKKQSHVASNDRETERLPVRDRMLLYMDRMKAGLDVIKMTFGPEWMYIWLMNEYGRAVNARMHIARLLKQHVAFKAEQVPAVVHQRGRLYHEPSTRPIPLLAFSNNLLRGSENIFGSTDLWHLAGSQKSRSTTAARPRSRTCPNLAVKDYYSSDDDDDDADDLLGNETPTFPEDPYHLSFPHRARVGKVDENHPISSPLPHPPLDTSSGSAYSHPCSHPRRPPTARKKPRSLSDSKLFQHPNLAGDLHLLANPLLTPPRPPRDAAKIAPLKTPQMHPVTPERTPPRRMPSKKDSSKTRKNLMSVLDCMLRQQDDEGNGMSQAVVTEISIMLWMMMDAGNAWTSMALHLLSRDEEACELVQEEIDYLISWFGREELFTPPVLGEMKYLDALLYEAIRLCPPFLGGLKVTSETVVLERDGIQIPKNSHVFFCQPTEQKFDIMNAVGKRPEDLGKTYPSIDLFGFLPFRGLEVPLMVLQSKVFLSVLLKNHTPCAPKKRKMFRRVRAASQRIMNSPIMKNSPRPKTGERKRMSAASSDDDDEDSPPKIPDSLIDCVVAGGDGSTEDIEVMDLESGATFLLRRLRPLRVPRSARRKPCRGSLRFHIPNPGLPSS